MQANKEVKCKKWVVGESKRNWQKDITHNGKSCLNKSTAKSLTNFLFHLPVDEKEIV